LDWFEEREFFIKSRRDYSVYMGPGAEKKEKLRKRGGGEMRRGGLGAGEGAGGRRRYVRGCNWGRLGTEGSLRNRGS